MNGVRETEWQMTTKRVHGGDIDAYRVVYAYMRSLSITNEDILVGTLVAMMMYIFMSTNYNC